MKIWFDMIHSLPVSLILFLLQKDSVGFPEKGRLFQVICLLITAWMVLLRHLKRKQRFLQIGIVTVFLAGVYFVIGKRSLPVEWIVRSVWLAGICACSVFLGILLEKSVICQRLTAVAVTGYCLFCAVQGVKLKKEFFFLAGFLLLVLVAEEIQRHWEKRGFPDRKEHLTRIAPLIFGLCVAVYFLPAPDKPYDWKLAKSLISHTATWFTKAYGFITHPSEDYSTIGFSEDGSFSSGLRNNDEEVLYITTGNTKLKELRLVGLVGSDFLGREWVFDTEKESSSRLMDTIETECAVRKYTGTSYSELITGVDLSCESRLYHTRYLFAPAKIRLGERIAGISLFSEQGGGIVSGKRISYKDIYRLSSYELNYAYPEFSEWLSSAKPIEREEWEKVAKAEKGTYQTAISYEAYQDYQNAMRESYGSATGVSENVQRILDQIQNASENRYRMAKILESYLSGMTYDMDCGPLPETVCDGKSFLDYFLAAKKGYCMHYATAFVLMARELGIPCRYVQGFYVTGGQGEFLVKQQNAHAWPEVYFDHVGWVAFEPTPGFSGQSGWAVPDRNKEEKKENSPKIDEGVFETEQNTEEPQEEKKDRKGKWDVRIILYPVAAVAGFLVLFFLGSRLLAKRRFHRMGERERFFILARSNLRYLGYLGFTLMPGETLAEFFVRLKKEDGEKLSEAAAFLPAYEKALYAETELSKEELLTVRESHRILKNLVGKSRTLYRLMLFFLPDEGY